MIIKEIIEVSKSKVKIILDDEFAFVLYKGELRSYKLKAGEELSKETYDEIINQVLTKRAKLRAMHLLEKRDYSEYKLREKLNEGGYPKQVIDTALEYVCSYGYVDDTRYAVSYINYASSSKSKKQIEQELLKKGISKTDIEKAYEEASVDLEPEEELIKTLLHKKHYDDMEQTYENKQKMIAFLYRKGFNLDKIYKVLETSEEFFE